MPAGCGVDPGAILRTACGPVSRHTGAVSVGKSASPPGSFVIHQHSAVLIFGVLAGSVLAWVGLLTLTSAQQVMGPPWTMPMSGDWSPTQTLLMLTMWVVMMVAMMLPSAYPVLAAYDRAVRSDARSESWLVAIFAAGYLVCWGIFATVATGLQWWLLAESTVDSMGVLVRPWAASLALMAAGIYELTPPSGPCWAAAGRPWGSSPQSGETGAPVLCAWVWPMDGPVWRAAGSSCSSCSSSG